MPSKVLIVEDDHDFATSLDLALDLVGLSAVIAGSAEQAHEIMQDADSDIHLGFFDIKLPGEDGITCLKKIRSHNPTFVGVIMTGFRDKDTLDRARQANPIEVLLKPFKIADFLGLAKAYSQGEQ